MSDSSNPGGEPKVQPRAGLFGRRTAPTPGSAAKPPPPAPPRKPRRRELSLLSGLLSFVLIGAVLGLAAFGWTMLQARKAGPLAADKVVVISREDDAGTIADQLEHEGVIDSATWFTVITLLDGNRGLLRRGEYLFKAGSSLKQVEDVLISGKPVLHSLTIPEGLTSDQIVQRMRDNDILVGEIKEIPREGSILPETYKFARGESRQAILSLMAKAQTKAVDEIWRKRAGDLPIKSPGELVTLASIVEKETGKADERPRVAGVFINRLQKRMRLQSDPTIVYGLVFGKGTLGHAISKAELEQPTPYNTYLIEGLPPGPIANPGKAAMEAVANPSHTKELYFVADGTGGHAFAETLDQHQKNVLHWRQIEKDAKDKLAPDAAPAAAPSQIKGELEPPDAKTFGPPPAAFAAAASPIAAAATARLAKLGAERQRREALLGPGGALSASASHATSLEDLGAVVAGVNDPPAEAQQAGADENASAQRMPALYPLSPAALADQRAREARYGRPQVEPRAVVVADAAAAKPTGPRPRGFDASEGTPLDPLLNKTFDLSFAKTIPALK